ncbi:longitudinals lacking protein, isoforms H/M/V isoform X1 [Hyalella azteca]|uniref:Longitudinals lacking protein, isoforms H/M/V isoform X1 n=1 Tax=Hyalella azteca TaxID=294128 RepID=A0A8B7PHX1_HYAAZ|nr:longitudinals lacking protein, isoforms H/M/V isoform X1 [Hyalella azteca]
MDSSGLLSLKWNNHSSTFTGVLSHLRINNLYTDATLACEGKVFSVHKLVLSTCSEYFQKIFEETDCRRPVIVLKDIKHTELDALLNYMYLGEVNVLQKDLSGLIKAAECLQVKGLAVADDVPSPPHRTNNSTHFKKSTKRLTSTSSDQEKSKRSRREPEQISDENEHTQSSTSRGKFNAANELHRESRQLCKANSKPSDDQRALKGTSQEIILDEEIKSEAFSPKLEDVDDYEANPSFDEAAQVSSAASSIQSSMQHHRPSADSVAHEDEGTANSEPKNSNSIQQDFSSDDILTRLGGGDVGGGAGAINVHSYILDANEYYDKDNDHEDVVCTSSPAVVSMSPRSCSTPDDGCKASRLGGGVGDTSSSSDVLHSALKDATDATCASSRLRDEDSSNAALRASAFSSDDFSSMSRDLDLVVNSLRDQQQLSLGYYQLTGNGTSGSCLLPPVSSPSSRNNRNNSSGGCSSASTPSSFLQSLQGSSSSSSYVARSYLCQTCGRRFNQKHHLRHHTYTHTGERPYACPHCEQTFTQTSSRNKHIKTMHPDVGFTSLSMVAPRYDVT